MHINIPAIYSIFINTSTTTTHLPNRSFNIAKLAIFIFLALFALAHVATAFRTTITTTVVEDEDQNPARKMESCREQIRMQQQLGHCQMHLREKCRGRSMLSMWVENPSREEGEQHLDECCQQLRNLNEQCRCEGLQQAVRRATTTTTGREWWRGMAEGGGDSDPGRRRKFHPGAMSAHAVTLSLNLIDGHARA